LGLALPASAANPSFRGFWADAFHEGFKSTSQINNMVARAVAGRYNAIVAEVLAYHDQTGSGHGAYWNSAIVPKATDISGGIDPLAYLCQQAHAQGIEVHAWLVTYRACTTWPPSGNSLVAAHPEWIMVPQAAMGAPLTTASRVDGAYVFDPGSPDVQEYLAGIVRELVTNYPIDGINWDYIRYTNTNAGYPSNTAYANSGLERYKRIYNTSTVPNPTGNANWDDFRRRTIDEHVRRSLVEMASIRTNPRQPLRHTADLICFGNAPANFTGSSAYALFQNWQSWMQKGYLDAGMPMNYKEEHCPTTEAVWYRNWVNAAINWRYNRHMFIGQAPYLNAMSGSLAQMQYGLAAGGDGLMSYSYYATRINDPTCNSTAGWSNDWSWYTYVAANLYTEVAPAPAMPWKDPATATEGTIWGRITTTAGAALDDASVVVNNQTIRTDGNGYYVATMLPAASGGTTYALVASKSGQPNGGHPAVRVMPGDVTRYDFMLGAAPAQIVLAAEPLNRTATIGGGLPDESFTFNKTGQAALIYTVGDDAAWLSVSPAWGIATGADQTVVIHYDLSGLQLPGQYTATITIADPAAVNSPATLPVRLTLKWPGVPGDFDGDEDVDLDDFGFFQICLTGTAGGVPAGCEKANFDNDNDVDQIDLKNYFLKCMTAPGVAGNPNCTDPPG
jgi:uncharacterized lipoprotein YddW (UPF0748 family)